MQDPNLTDDASGSLPDDSMAPFVTSPYVTYGNGTLDDLLGPAQYEDVPASALRLLDEFSQPRLLSSVQGDQQLSGQLPAALQKRWLLPYQDIWAVHNVTAIEIEISTHCNWRCAFCPVGTDPKPQEAMDLALFQEILEKAVALGTTQSVSINSYNEPTIDRQFDDRVRMIASSGLKLVLHTNGTLLTDERLRRLKEMEVVDYLCFNLPSLERDEFSRLTGVHRRNLDRSIHTIETSLSLDLPTYLSVNGTATELATNLPAIQQAYSEQLCEPLEAWKTSDRCGVLENRYALDIDVSHALVGCSNVLNWLFVSVDGDCFICCEDYYQNEVFANVRDGPFDKVLASPAAQDLRRRVFGAQPCGDDFLCRHCSLMLARRNRVARLGHSLPHRL